MNKFIWALGLLLVGAAVYLLAQRQSVLNNSRWKGRCSPKLNAEILTKSLQLGTEFLLQWQKPAGNFQYEYDWLTKKSGEFDNQVRQAGALWGLALLYHNRPSAKLEQGLLQGFAFFEEHSKLTKSGARYIIYPGDKSGRTGTVALVALAHIDYLRAKQLILGEAETGSYSATTKNVHKQLGQYLDFIESLMRPDKLWHGSYYHRTGRPYGDPSPYSDGEALLALVKAARYLGRADYKQLVMEAADAGYRVNVEEALKEDPDSPITKGYYQWSSMSFFELASSEWEGTEKYGKWVTQLATWMIDVHRTLDRRKNTAYAYEGIIHAYQMARRKGDQILMQRYGCVIELGLTKLTSWQVGSPLANSYITEQFDDDRNALGGVQNAKDEALLRVDVTQHQMAAVILALKYYFL